MQRAAGALCQDLILLSRVFFDGKRGETEHFCERLFLFWELCKSPLYLKVFFSWHPVVPSPFQNLYLGGFQWTFF